MAKKCSKGHTMYGDFCEICHDEMLEQRHAHTCTICGVTSYFKPDRETMTYPNDWCNIAIKMDCGHYMFDDCDPKGPVKNGDWAKEPTEHEAKLKKNMSIEDIVNSYSYDELKDKARGYGLSLGSKSKIAKQLIERGVF